MNRTVMGMDGAIGGAGRQAHLPCLARQAQAVLPLRGKPVRVMSES